MHVALVILITASVLSMVIRAWPATAPTRRRTSRSILKVLIADAASAPWRTYAWDIVSACEVPGDVQVCMLLSCANENDAQRAAKDVPPFVSVHTSSRAVPIDAAERWKRLERRFVNGDEDFVVSIHPSVVLRGGWDDVLVRSRGPSADVLLTFPTSSTASFPVVESVAPLRVRNAKFFLLDETTVPVVCACLECVAGSPASIARFFKTPRSVDVRTIAVPFASSPRSFDGVEWRVVLQEDASSLYAGLTTNSSDEERIQKYGSTAAAKIALKFSKRT